MLRHKFFHRAKKVVISEEELCKIRGIKKKVKEHKKEKKSNEKEKEESKENKDTIGGKDSDDKVEEKRIFKVINLFRYVWKCIWINILWIVMMLMFGYMSQYPYTTGSLEHLLIAFCLLWVPTLGRCHLWLLPNLTADVGFFASFWPLYQYEYYGPISEGDKKVNKKKKKKEKDSDTEETCSTQLEEKSDTKESLKEHTQIEEKKLPSSELVEGEEGSEGSESDKSNTGRDFVML
ncbi:Translocation protein SEC62 [Habropoda laboriosa]|uniref:Translocation protein SEC62 n=1 Tax=Habropoda laboriosa TaxID=597456 RepID=A0A0L7QJZ1_9HYME|nr:Translocation protein SEC62 [Habropoda laboriosa]